jgi:hypothetical protein
MATSNRERMAQSGGDQFVPPRMIDPSEAPYLRNMRTGEIHLYHDTLARLGDQIFEPCDEAPEWLSRITRINEAKAAAARAAVIQEQAENEEIYLKDRQKSEGLPDPRVSKAKVKSGEVPSFMTDSQ